MVSVNGTHGPTWAPPLPSPAATVVLPAAGVHAGTPAITVPDSARGRDQVPAGAATMAGDGTPIAARPAIPLKFMNIEVRQLGRYAQVARHERI